MQPVTSTQIHSIGYNAEGKHMDIQFHGRNGAPGSTYRYFGVEPEHHAAIMKAESVGSHFGKHVKGKFEFQKLPADDKKAQA